jgi:hypothetical protein
LSATYQALSHAKTGSLFISAKHNQQIRKQHRRWAASFGVRN